MTSDHLTDEILQEACQQIADLRSGTFDDSQLAEIVSSLDRLLPDPNWFGYTIDHEPELSEEEVVRRAFAYEPIHL